MTKYNDDIVSIHNLNIKYAIDTGEFEVLKDISLTISRNEIVCIVGASGCGKSTLLKIIGGLEKEFSGDVRIKGIPVTGPGTDRGIAFQEPRLFPWLTVEKNVMFGLPEAMSRAEKNELVDDHIRLVGLEKFAGAYPHQLSGGMQQRASIARALVNRPDVLLLDEPFGALDAFTRISMQQELLKIWQKEKTTLVMVTHDIDEAVYLADRVVLMSRRPGTIKKIIHNEAARPRKRSSLEYIRVRNEIYQEFFAEFDTDIEYFI